jgi:biopolymer transport protein ExbD
MKPILFSTILILGLSVPALATGTADHPPIAFVVPGASSTPIDRSQFLFLVVEAGFISHEGQPIAAEAVTDYINNALKAQGATKLAVHIRQGIKYGEVVQALDLLRKTEAKSIGVSMVELATGRDL